MPNWCVNELTITSNNKEQLKQFIEKVRDPENDTELSLTKLFPCPEELLSADSTFYKSLNDESAKLLIMKYGQTNWYEWCIANWGTKWDVENVELKNCDDHYVCYCFDSAWSPPTKWIVHVALMFPDLYFFLKYDETGVGFMGVYKAHGNKTEDLFIDYSGEF